MKDDLPSQHISDADLALGVGALVFLILLPTIVWLAVVMLRSRK
ncbi:hypothetical protein ACNF49_01140 [Actinomadura sp. ATCC 39365]